MESILRLFSRKNRRSDNDPRVHVTKSISMDEFITVNDQSYKLREEVLPEALTLEFWQNSGLVRFLLDERFLKSEILDVGCGSGEIDVIVARKGYSITAVDISPYAIDLARKLAEKYPECGENLRFLAGDIEKIVFDRKFSSAIVSHTLEHVIDAEKTMERVLELLHPGSYVLVAVPNRKAWNDRTHLRYYSKKSLDRFLSQYSCELDVRVDSIERMLFAVMKTPGNENVPNLTENMSASSTSP